MEKKKFVRALEMRSVHALELPLFKSVIPWIIEEPKSITDFKSLVSANSRKNPLLAILSCRIMERVMGPISRQFFMAALKLEEVLYWIEEEKDQAFVDMTMQDVQTSDLNDEYDEVKKYLSIELFRMVKLIVDAGAHVDMANFDDVTSLQLAKATTLEPLLLSYRNLQCLAASAVAKRKISFENILSKDMCEFVKMHFW
ncbi:unnamed protein product [Mytilus coruscus]|uniref:Uncharacterized protein n=1 Tax=Mytilus coruscus TaxID=42192 RepID=A0A6J8CZE5_MYTCO|nr:unnamed protein product [Mytilus coruscus]